MADMIDPFSVIDSWMPDERIIEDVKRVVEFDGNGVIEFDSGPITIPAEVPYKVVRKSLVKQDRDFGFGPCFYAIVSIGESTLKHGIMEAEFAFATFWYTPSGELITTDFDSGCPS